MTLPGNGDSFRIRLLALRRSPFRLRGPFCAVVSGRTYTNYCLLSEPAYRAYSSSSTSFYIGANYKQCRHSVKVSDDIIDQPGFVLHRWEKYVNFCHFQASE